LKGKRQKPDPGKGAVDEWRQKWCGVRGGELNGGGQNRGKGGVAPTGVSQFAEEREKRVSKENAKTGMLRF